MAEKMVKPCLMRTVNPSNNFPKRFKSNCNRFYKRECSNNSSNSSSFFSSSRW